MKNTFGNNICVTLFGESHGAGVGVVIDGLAPGIEVNRREMENILLRRRPSLATDTPRVEQDNFQILSGVFNDKTTGTPLTVFIPNENTKSKDYVYGPARPSHADYAAYCKYHGYEDYRGGGHFSGRLTAALVAAGGILIPALEKLGIYIGTHIESCCSIKDRQFGDPDKAQFNTADEYNAYLDSVRTDISMLKGRVFPTLDELAGEAMKEEIVRTGKEQDSTGGITETIVCGLDAGVGEPWFDGLDALIAHALLSIGAVKGIEFGAGFALSTGCGSRRNDQMRISEGGQVFAMTNSSGGITGGISNGMPVIFRCAVKPTPSIGLSQQTVDFVKKENIEHTISGRHDPAVIRRICPVIDSVSAIVIADQLAGRYGTDVFINGIK